MGLVVVKKSSFRFPDYTPVMQDENNVLVDSELLYELVFPKFNELYTVKKRDVESDIWATCEKIKRMLYLLCLNTSFDNKTIKRFRKLIANPEFDNVAADWIKDCIFPDIVEIAQVLSKMPDYKRTAWVVSNEKGNKFYSNVLIDMMDKDISFAEIYRTSGEALNSIADFEPEEQKDLRVKQITISY